jgi:hypothetical protein
MAQENNINTVIVLRHDSTTTWANSAYKLREGEVGVGYMTRTVKDDEGNDVTKSMPIVKVGDGQHVWSDLPQAEGVFEEDVVLTYNFGRHKTSNGSVNTGGVGMTTSEWLMDALSEVLNPKTNYPTASLSANGHTTDTGTNEIGSKIKAIKWTTNTSAGSYVGNDGNGTYGSTGGTSNKTGISTSNDFTWSISNETDGATSVETSGTFNFVSDKYIQIDSTSEKTYAYFNGSVTLDPSNAYTPKNNLGREYEAGKITGFDKSGTKTKDFTDIPVKATGYRDSWYYVGTDCTFALDSATIREKATAKGANTTSFGTVTIPEGTTRVMFAVLGDKTLKSVIDVDGQQLDVKANFTKETVAIEGANGYEAANYSVFHFENENGVKATKYTVTIG